MIGGVVLGRLEKALCILISIKKIINEWGNEMYQRKKGEITPKISL